MLVIALFYTDELTLSALAAAVFTVLVLMNGKGVRALPPSLVGGVGVALLLAFSQRR